MLKRFVNSFTTPALVGVDWGSAAVKVVELERAGGQLLLRRAAVSPIETPRWPGWTWVPSRSKKIGDDSTFAKR